MRHVDEGLLHAWLDGERAALEPGAADEVRRHLAGCGECRARLEEARGLRDRAEALLRGGDPAGMEVDVPPFEALAARPAPARHGRGRMLAWAASLALALGAGWLARAAMDPGEPPTRTAATPRPTAPSAPASPRTPAGATPGNTVGEAAAPAETAVSEPTVAPRPVPEPSLRVAAREEGGRAEPAGAPPAELVPDVSPPPPPPPPPAAMESAPPTSAPAADVAAPQARTARRAERAAPSAPAPAPPLADSAGAGRPALGPEALELEGLVVAARGSEAGVLAGATVEVAGTRTRTVSAADGTYRLVVPRSAVRDGKIALEARMLGYEPIREEVRVAGDEVRLDLRLRPAVLALEGLVVTGTGAEAGVLAGAVGPDAEGWFSARPDAPRRLLGREPLRVRGLPTVSVQVGRLEGRTVVRVRQRLAGGGLLTLVQAPDRPAGAAAPADSSSLPEARDEVPAEQARLVRRVGGITVTASAPLPADALARLLDGLR
ncbi:MAG: zf-HC2 domain-containing protein [Gemmatimonadota bacterium]